MRSSRRRSQNGSGRSWRPWEYVLNSLGSQVFDPGEGMIRRGDRAQTNYRRSEALPGPSDSPKICLMLKKSVLQNTHYAVRRSNNANNSVFPEL